MVTARIARKMLWPHVGSGRSAQLLTATDIKSALRRRPDPPATPAPWTGLALGICWVEGAHVGGLKLHLRDVAVQQYETLLAKHHAVGQP
jgi:hypothetical protein